MYTYMYRELYWLVWWDKNGSTVNLSQCKQTSPPPLFRAPCPHCRGPHCADCFRARQSLLKIYENPLQQRKKTIRCKTERPTTRPRTTSIQLTGQAKARQCADLSGAGTAVPRRACRGLARAAMGKHRLGKSKVSRSTANRFLQTRRDCAASGLLNRLFVRCAWD